MNDFHTIFISHRSYDREVALKLHDFLLQNHISSRVILWEKESLCYNNEQLTVHDYFEAIERIKKSMQQCTAFFYIDSPVFSNGYFTSAELLQWKRLHDKPYVYRISYENGDFSYQKIELQPLTTYEKRQMSFTSYWSNPDRLIDTEGGVFMDAWGKYAKDCFLVSCCACGQYYLITRKKMMKYVEGREKVLCPHCNRHHAVFLQKKDGVKFFANRTPILIHPLVEPVADHAPLGTEDVLDLMNARKLPERFPLDKEDGEKLKSDFRKQAEFTGKFTAGLVGGLAVLGAIISFFDKNK